MQPEVMWIWWRDGLGGVSDGYHLEGFNVTPVRLYKDIVGKFMKKAVGKILLDLIYFSNWLFIYK